MNRAALFVKDYAVYMILFFYGVFYHISSSEFWPITISKTWLTPEYFEYSILQKPLLSIFLALFHLIPLSSFEHLILVKIIFSLLGVIGLHTFINIVKYDSKIHTNLNLAISLVFISPLFLNNFFEVRTDQLAFLFFSIFIVSYLQKSSIHLVLSLALLILTGIKEIIIVIPALALFYFYFKEKLTYKIRLYLFASIFAILLWVVALNFLSIDYLLDSYRNSIYPSPQLRSYLSFEGVFFFLSIAISLINLINKKHKIFSSLSLYFSLVLLVFPQLFEFFLASITPFIYLPLIIFSLRFLAKFKQRYSVLFLLSLIFVKTNFNFNNLLAYNSNLPQLAYISQMQAFLSKYNLTYLDGMGVFTRNNFVTCFISPNDDLTNVNCFNKISVAEADVVMVTSRLILFADQLFVALNKNYIQLYPNFWIKKTKATNSILKDQNLDLQPLPMIIF